MGFIKNITDKFNIKIFSIKEFEKVTSAIWVEVNFSTHRTFCYFCLLQ